MVLIRQSFAVVTINPVKPAPEKQRTTRTAMAARESRPGAARRPRATGHAGISVWLNWPPGSEQSERRL